MKLPVNPHLPNSPIELIRLLRDITQQVNYITEGNMFAHHAATTAAPTTGSFAQGDHVKNSTPTELGTAGSKYVVDGWKCVASGNPGTFVEMRSTTGN